MISEITTTNLAAFCRELQLSFVVTVLPSMIYYITAIVIRALETRAALGALMRWQLIGSEPAPSAWCYNKAEYDVSLSTTEPFRKPSRPKVCQHSHPHSDRNSWHKLWQLSAAMPRAPTNHSLAEHSQGGYTSTMIEIEFKRGIR